jgi:hypothetical protein
MLRISIKAPFCYEERGENLFAVYIYMCGP